MRWRQITSSSSRNPQPGFGEAAAPRSLPLLIQFTYLQLLDALTTLAFLTTGVHEANPVVRLAMAGARSPLFGLLALKVLAFAAAVFCIRTGRVRLLTRINIFFAVLVVWNLVALLGT